MKVYHGSTSVIETPLTHVGRSNLDFGKGFYITPFKEQAVLWACRPANREKEHWLNVYEMNYSAIMSDFNTKIFPAYNEEWLDFILDSRQGGDKWKAYDFIEGGIANDRIFNTIELFTAHLITKEVALSRLAYEKPNEQICILNQQIIDRCMSFVESIKL